MGQEIVWIELNASLELFYGCLIILLFNMDSTQAVMGWSIFCIQSNGFLNFLTCFVISALTGIDITQVAMGLYIIWF